MRIPLHGAGSALDLHRHMIELNPAGFRKVPTSRKNPKTRAKHPVTRMEKLAKKEFSDAKPS